MEVTNGLRGALAVLLILAFSLLVSAWMYGPGLRPIRGPRPPEPSLEVDNEAEYRTLRNRQLMRLNTYGPDHIPITLAKRLVLQEGVR